ncbi:hypothetical protein J2Z21_008762 [Streptomyces griseochromogenes]|uniref:Uncharacterized protein n=1 Tax=Streptomyces griseochromogenes TaxID=68214 RepID=A0A1B1B0K7_9ACTN|nr:hypothetical protein [Streptomyces griseochromogenes]ANP52330.1 hypothetical protein AVL59_24780 [Streptomyces griseochromogenes]MBP2055746.1 hypothetical protein [Streptomyces griseochromogenes]
MVGSTRVRVRLFTWAGEMLLGACCRRPGQEHTPSESSQVIAEVTRRRLFDALSDTGAGYKDGVPVIHVPSASVPQALVDAADHDARMAVLVRMESTVMADCEAAVLACVSVEEFRTIGIKVMEAWRAGHREAAACLALAGAEEAVFQVTGVSRKRLDDSGRSGKYPGLQRVAARGALPHWGVESAALLGPLRTLYVNYHPERNDPLPTALSRHAVFHRLTLDHLHAGHSIVAIMLMASMFREIQVYCDDALAEEHEQG